MQGIFRSLRHLALIALIVRAMIPAGWMPDAQGMAICSATLGAIHHDAHGPSDQKTSHEDCPFAATSHLAAAPDAPALILPGLHAFAAATDRATAAAIADRFTPQAPRAPPAFA